jgi:hypothetical protein
MPDNDALVSELHFLRSEVISLRNQLNVLSVSVIKLTDKIDDLVKD